MKRKIFEIECFLMEQVSKSFMDSNGREGTQDDKEFFRHQQQYRTCGYTLKRKKVPNVHMVRRSMTRRDWH